MAHIQEKTKGRKIISFKFKTCLGRDENGKQIFKCSTNSSRLGLDGTADALESYIKARISAE